MIVYASICTYIFSYTFCISLQCRRVGKKIDFEARLRLKPKIKRKKNRLLPLNPKGCDKKMYVKNTNVKILFSFNKTV